MQTEKQNGEKIPVNILLLGLVSMFNDIASEMIYPIVPIFLKVVLGAPAAVIGLIEGMAEAVASILKVYSGWLSDKIQKRKELVVAGYSMSTLSKFMMALAHSWPAVFWARFLDRAGKGVRTSARDALIAESSEEKSRGRDFGVHRALDTMGAILGPILALYILALFNNNFNQVFLFAGIPSFIGVLILILLVKDKRPAPSKAPVKFSFKWNEIPRPFKIFLFISLVFAIGNNSDAFIILRAQDLGLSAANTVWAYVLFNACFALFAAPAGVLSDRVGEKKALLFGFLTFALVYLSFGFVAQTWAIWLLFFVYGFYYAFNDGISKAYISKIVPKDYLATAMGLYLMVTGLGVLIASILAGVLWDKVSHSAPFYLGGLLALLASALFVFLEKRMRVIS